MILNCIDIKNRVNRKSPLLYGAICGNTGGVSSMRHGGLVSRSKKRSLIEFEWKVCSKGYRLSDDGKAIISRGGPMKTIRPDEMRPSPYYLFGDMWGRTRARGISAAEGAEFWQRTFKSEREFLLDFVNEHGFLETAEAASENIQDLVRFSDGFASFDIFREIKGPKNVALYNENVPDFHLRPKLVNSGGEVELKLEPSNLLIWMWWRLGEDLRDDVMWGKCKNCEKPMARGLGYFRADAEFCSKYCATVYGRRNK